MALYRKLNRETRIRRSILSSLTKDVLLNGHVNTTEQRAKEAQRIGFNSVAFPKRSLSHKPIRLDGVETVGVAGVFDLLNLLPREERQ